MTDVELITRKILLITRDLDALSAIARTSLDDFLASSTDEVLAERYLERLIGRMIDINYHLLTEAGRPPPADYPASFTQLAAMGVLDLPFARQIASCAGLRNRILHAYDDLDPTAQRATGRRAGGSGVSHQGAGVSGRTLVAAGPGAAQVLVIPSSA